MKAMLRTGHGGLEMLRYGDAPDPVPVPDEIVVDVHAASVNAADYKVRLGGRNYNLKFPHILGRDFSGVVAKTGESVTDFAVGTRCSAFWMRESKVRMRKNSPFALRSPLVSRTPCLTCKLLRWR